MHVILCLFFFFWENYPQEPSAILFSLDWLLPGAHRTAVSLGFPFPVILGKHAFQEGRSSISWFDIFLFLGLFIIFFYFGGAHSSGASWERSIPGSRASLLAALTFHFALNLSEWTFSPPHLCTSHPLCPQHSPSISSLFNYKSSFRPQFSFTSSMKPSSSLLDALCTFPNKVLFTSYLDCGYFLTHL